MFKPLITLKSEFYVIAPLLKYFEKKESKVDIPVRLSSLESADIFLVLEK